MSPVFPLDLSLDTGAAFLIPVPFSLLNTAFLLPEPSIEFSLAPEAAFLVVLPLDTGPKDGAGASDEEGASDGEGASAEEGASDEEGTREAAGLALLVLSRAAFTAADISGCREEITCAIRAPWFRGILGSIAGSEISGEGILFFDPASKPELFSFGNPGLELDAIFTIGEGNFEAGSGKDPYCIFLESDFAVELVEGDNGPDVKGDTCSC